MRRRLRLLANIFNAVLRAPTRALRQGPEPEKRSADEVKRRLEETHSRLKREHPPLDDLDQL